MKECTKCGERKLLTDFYKRAASPDGLQPLCKVCDNIRTRDNPRLREARKLHSRKWRKANPDKVNGHRQRYPERYKAQIALNNAIRDGKLVRQPCEVCGAKGEAHHEDYSKPLEVRWLCRKHHMEQHRKL